MRTKESLTEHIARANRQSGQDGNEWHSIVAGNTGNVIVAAWLPSGSSSDVIAFAERELGIDMGSRENDVTTGDLRAETMHSVGHVVCDTNEPPTSYGFADTYEHARALALWVSSRVLDRRFGITPVE